ncbi:hypothetical protein KJ742_01095 [Patescibacteria group bacterium]|nr:hypothetical protein [Patescibacteria group bacterium]
MEQLTIEERQKAFTFDVLPKREIKVDVSVSKDANNKHIANIYVSYKMKLVKGLLTECPLDKPLDDCLAKKIRGLRLEEPLQLVKTMDETELNLIISHHQHCFQKRRREQLYNI